MGVSIRALSNLVSVAADHVEIACVYTGRSQAEACSAVVMVTAQVPVDTLYHGLIADIDALADAGIDNVARLGDCLGPGTIAAAVWSGHRYSREREVVLHDEPPFLRERPELSQHWPASWDAAPAAKV
jgi:dimethylamine/trimethylamine dehydrogenase